MVRFAARDSFRTLDPPSPSGVEPPSYRPPKIVSRMRWTDQDGNTVRYTGQVNENMRPHGTGVATYEDGTVLPLIWDDGLPLQ